MQIWQVWRNLMDMAANWSFASMVIRLGFALLVGVLIGIDRGLKRRSAGIKTHALVCLGAALVMLTSQYMSIQFDTKTDMARLGAQVISGVGFLGVGTIIVTGKNQVRGLTTAAGLWACACVGLAIGIGFLEGEVITLVLIMITLRTLSRVDMWMHRYAKAFDLYLEFDTNKSISTFLQELHNQDVKVGLIEVTKSKIKGEGPTAVVSIEVKSRMNRPQLMNEIRTMETIRYVEEL